MPSPASDQRLLPETRGLNFYALDPSLPQLLALYLPADLYAHLQPHLHRLGALASTRLDELAHTADRHPPQLHPRDRHGREVPRIEKHPAYLELERYAFAEFGLAAMSHRGGVLGWPQPLPHVAKYAFFYLFAQAEFGLCCPVSMTDTLFRTLRKYGSAEQVARYLPGLLATDLDALVQGAMFMTEQAGGSDVGALETVARQEGGQWRLYGEKWFCSNADAGLALVLARPEGAPPGLKGLALFLLPRLLPDGRPNAYRIVRLKDKLGSRSMATGEIRLEGALAYPVGDLQRGFVQIAEMMNMSRLSNAVRAAGLMRRALHEALCVARHRVAFGRPLLQLPLMQRQLLKLMVPMEQALSLVTFTAAMLEAMDGGDEQARRVVRLLTPLLKFRACRDARKVTGDAMEVRGGCGYIEEWVEARLVRDAHLGSIWEGTSNIVALDVRRAVRKEGGHEALAAVLQERLAAAESAPAWLRQEVSAMLHRAVAAVQETAYDPQAERRVRQVASALYHAASAALLLWEGAAAAARWGDARRWLLAWLVLAHRLRPRDPLAAAEPVDEAALAPLLLAEQPVPVETAAALLAVPAT
ncbi:MAG: acyl-CoA dehydrogenase [Candidatus Tectimicrobiota bacterium]|nr:MAG: acyl-CoA dehydrogenase [Candidatus Tectomicrobia bacterium]